MSVSKKLTLGFLIVLILTAVVSIVGIIGMRGLHDSAAYMYENRVKSLSYVNSVRSVFTKMRLEGRGLVINSFYDDKEWAVSNNDAFDKYALEFIGLMERCKETSDTEELLDFYDKIMVQFSDYYLPSATRNNINCINDIPAHANKSSINEEMAYIDTVSEIIDGYIIELVSLNNALAEQASIDNTGLTQMYIVLQISFLFSAIAVAVIIARVIVKSITTPIREAVYVLECIGNGDLFKQIEGDYKGEFEIIKNSINDAAMQIAVYINETKVAQELVLESCLETARVEAKAEAMISGINYASSIQRNILPTDNVFKKAFSDYSVTWKPRDIVSGDIYWLRNFEAGSLLCVCDCTGHGTPGALLTMLVTSIFNSSVNEENCTDTAQVIYTLDKRLYGALNANSSETDDSLKDGCDMAAIFVAKDGSVNISSAHTRVFVCDGKDVTQIKGQNIYVGEGGLERKEDVEVITLPANAGNKFYIASDGLFDQTGGEKGVPFGYKRFINHIIENHNESHASIAEKMWDTFEEYRHGMERLDDYELISFTT